MGPTLLYSYSQIYCNVAKYDYLWCHTHRCRHCCLANTIMSPHARPTQPVATHAALDTSAQYIELEVDIAWAWGKLACLEKKMQAIILMSFIRSTLEVSLGRPEDFIGKRLVFRRKKRRNSYLLASSVAICVIGVCLGRSFVENGVFEWRHSSDIGRHAATIARRNSGNFSVVIGRGGHLSI